MKNTQFNYLIVKYLKGQYLAVEEYGEDELTLNLRDVNCLINGGSWELGLLKVLNEVGLDVTFSYGDGDWVTVHKK